MTGDPDVGGGQRLRVLVLSRAYPNNLNENSGLWVERPTRLLSRSCDVRVVAPVEYCPPLPRLRALQPFTRFRDLVRREVRHGIDVYHPPVVVGPGRSLYSLEGWTSHLGLRSLVERLRSEFPFDVIHAHAIYPSGVVARRLSRRYGVPFVVTEHAPWRDVPDVRRRAMPLARDAAYLIAVSRYVRETIAPFTGGFERIRVIPNGVDGDAFPLGAGPRRRDQVLFVGFVNFNKGIDVLLEAMRAVAAARPEATLVLVGGAFYRDTRAQEERLRAMAADLSLASRVTFTGPRPPEEVARHMRESAVLVLPSRDESFGSVLVEALASGTPVVATRSGGPQDIVTPEVGHLVDVGDAAALGDALVSVLSAPGRFDPARLRHYALSRFGWERNAEDTYRVYLDALQAHRREPGVRGDAAARPA